MIRQPGKLSNHFIYYLKKLFFIFGYCLVPLAYLIPKDRKNIVLVSRFGDFDGSMKYLYLYLNSLADENFNFYFVVSNNVIYNNLANLNFKVLFYPKLKTLFKLLRMSYLIVDGNEWTKKFMYYFLFKTRKVQIWHGTGIKTIGLLKPSIIKLSYLQRRFSKEFTYYHLLTLTSQYQAEVRSQAFKYGKLLINGLPRNDLFFQSNLKLDLIGSDDIVIKKSRLSKQSGFRVIAYTPTWRNFDNSFEQLNLESLNEFAAKNKIIFIIKMHYKNAYLLNLPLYDHIFEYDRSSDIYPLLLITDMLITDYSSIYFDYLLLDRPIIFYPYDFEEYKKNERGFLVDYENVTPGPVCYTQDQLEENVYRNIIKGEDGYSSQRNKLRNQFFKYIDGKSSERLWSAIKEDIL